jgi:hypothetical protein
MALYRSGDAERALALIHAGEAASAKSPVLHAFRAMAHCRSGRLDAAREALRLANETLLQTMSEERPSKSFPPSTNDLIDRMLSQAVVKEAESLVCGRRGAEKEKKGISPIDRGGGGSDMRDDPINWTYPLFRLCDARTVRASP